MILNPNGQTVQASKSLEGDRLARRKPFVRRSTGRPRAAPRCAGVRCAALRCGAPPPPRGPRPTRVADAACGSSCHGCSARGTCAASTCQPRPPARLAAPRALQHGARARVATGLAMPRGGLAPVRRGVATRCNASLAGAATRAAWRREHMRHASPSPTSADAIPLPLALPHRCAYLIAEV